MPSNTSQSSHSSSQSGATSFHSETSTLEYGHERFETFRVKVATLCRTLWSSPNIGFKVERCSGGSYNRIIAITADHEFDVKVPQDLILRIPRFEGVELQKEIDALEYVKDLSDIPVPVVVAADLTADNILERPYTFQKKIPGITLQSVYPNLSHRQQLSIAKQIGEIQLKLLGITGAVAGVVQKSAIEPQNPTTTQARSPELPTFIVRPFEARSPYSDADSASHFAQTLTPPIEGILPFMHSRFQAWKQEALEPDPDDNSIADYYDRLATTATEMSHSQLFGKNVFTYCHMDLAPRNILVSINDSDLSITISGLLDWDDCGFAPMIFSCNPATWLWAWVEDESEDEMTAGEEPPTENSQQLKRAYEAALGEEYLEYFYGVYNRMARKLVRLALRGIHSNEDLNDADALLEEWDQKREGVSKSSLSSQ